MRIKAFITHKLCEDYSSCQDYYSINMDNSCICLCDGMSQSIFPDYWAQIVSKHFAENFDLTEESRLELCSEWRSRVERYIQSEIEKGENPWRIQCNLEEGYSAGCTICSLKMSKHNDWEGKVLGDSCIIVFHKENNTIEILSSEDKVFDSYPDFVDSNPSNLGRGQVKTFGEVLNESTCILLVSDPFSEFLRLHINEAEKYLNQICALDNHENFLSLVQEWRSIGMHNDDSSLIIIEFDNNREIDIDYYDSLEELSNSELKDDEERLSSLIPEDSTNKDIKKLPELSQENINGIENIIQHLSEHSNEVIMNFLDKRENAPWYMWAFSWKTRVHELLSDYNNYITKISKKQ